MNKEIDWNAPFTLEMFRITVNGKFSPECYILNTADMQDAEDLVNFCNARFRELLAQAPNVYGRWVANDQKLGIVSHDSHQAKLIAIEEIKG